MYRVNSKISPTSTLCSVDIYCSETWLLAQSVHSFDDLWCSRTKWPGHFHFQRCWLMSGDIFSSAILEMSHNVNRLVSAASSGSRCAHIVTKAFLGRGRGRTMRGPGGQRIHPTKWLQKSNFSRSRHGAPGKWSQTVWRDILIAVPRMSGRKSTDARSNIAFKKIPCN